MLSSASSALGLFIDLVNCLVVPMRFIKNNGSGVMMNDGATRGRNDNTLEAAKMSVGCWLHFETGPLTIYLSLHVFVRTEAIPPSL